MRTIARWSPGLTILPLFGLLLPGCTMDTALGAGGSRVTIAPAADSDWGKPMTGRLANGLRFVVLPRRGSEPGLGVLMRDEGGFIAERRPGERGLAHLIEHIAFHSPTGGSPEDVDHLKRIGVPLTFPAPNAGSTSWRETNYYFSTRTTADLDTLLRLLREVTADMTLRADAVDMSRDEVVREMADKKLGNDIFASYVAAVAPGSPNDVIDAQNSDDVPTASVPAIRDLYRRLYRPENVMIVVVGNVDAAAVTTLIEKRFANWKPAGPAAPRATFPRFQRDRIRPVSFSARPLGRRTAMTTVVMPTPAPPRSRIRQAEAEIMDLLAMRAIDARLAAARSGQPPGRAGVFIESGEQGYRQIMLWADFPVGQWQPAITGLRTVTCHLSATGFTEEEWTAAERAVIADLEHRAATMAEVRNVDLARDLSHAIADGRALIPPDELLRDARSLLPRLDARAASRWWRHQWGSGPEHLRVEAPELAEVADPEAAIRTAVDAPGCTMRH